MLKIRVFERCVSELARLPGVGRKTATRLALHILKARADDVERLAASIRELKEKTTVCRRCGGIAEKELCEICADSYRKQQVVCVVEEAKDVFTIESTGQFDGVYHVLGGKISPLDGVGPDELRVKELVERIEKGGVDEVILATNPDVEGETTAVYLGKLLKKFPELSVTRIASGVPIGVHLEYADEITLLKAFEGRRRYE